MFESFLQKIDRDIPRVSRDVWLSFVHDLAVPAVRTPHSNLLIRPATDDDIERIAASADKDEPIVGSCLRFWQEHGFRSLYLGFQPGDAEPSIFQYAIDERDNHRFAGMLYGRMYRLQTEESVQLENIYTFRSKRRRSLALDFELQLFGQLHRHGRRLARTHISIRNRAALLWAATVGFRPDHWITMVSIDLPVLRDRRKWFAFTPLREAERAKYPLSLFRT